MQFEGRRRAAAAPNLTPLIDIVFLLLVFFMLTAHFVRDEGLPVELPEATSAATLDNDKPVEVTLAEDGTILIAGNTIPQGELTQQLKLALARTGDKRIVIKGDAAATLGISVKVIDAARAAGAEGVDIVTRQPGGRP